MEVHHHSHTPRQRWSHYFWEFFMLFLAVTLGFFVENQREHIIEHRREKQYIRSMIVDLTADTAKQTAIFKLNTKIIDRIDSILTSYDAFVTGKPSGVFLRNQHALQGFPDFIYTDRTINQLKSSGGMRLIRKQAASDSIIVYDDLARDYLIEQDATSKILHEMTQQYMSILNLRLIKKFAADPSRLEEFKTTDILLTTDKSRLETFYNTIDLFQGALQVRNIEIIKLKNQATRLIAFLREQYHLD